MFPTPGYNTLDPELTHGPSRRLGAQPVQSHPHGYPVAPRLSTRHLRASLASPGGGEVSPSWPLSSPARLPAGPAHPNCSRYGRLRGCDTLRGRGPETDMLGQQLPCSITVPAEGRDLGRSQWHFPLPPAAP